MVIASASPPGAAEPVRVLYLGWERAAVEALNRLGADVSCVVSAADRGKPATEAFEGPVAVARDHTSVEDVLGALADLGLTPGAFDAICTEDEFAIVTAAALDSLGRGGGMPVPVALALRDKAVQKKLIREAGIPVADSWRLPDSAAVEEALRTKTISTPCVVKPLSGAGSMHTFVVSDSDEPPPSDLAIVGPWLVEPFIAGEELHLDGHVRDGEPALISISRYLHNVIEVHDGRIVASATLDARTEPELITAGTELTARALTALGHTDGVFHLEAFHDDGKLTFSECAGRIGGGLILETVRDKHGVDLYDEWAAAVLGTRSPAAATGHRTIDDSFGWVNLTAPPGRLLALPTQEDLAARPGVVTAQIWATVGDRTHDPRQGSHLLLAKAAVRAPSEAAVRRLLVEVDDWFKGQVEVGEGL